MGSNGTSCLPINRACKTLQMAMGSLIYFQMLEDTKQLPVNVPYCKLCQEMLPRMLLHTADLGCGGLLRRLFTQTKNFPPAIHSPPSSPQTDPPTTTMDKRSGETPMDFEWQSRGPGDVTSPFYQLGLQHENKKRRCISSRRPAEPGATLTRQY